MSQAKSSSFTKIVNPYLARMALHGAKTFGEFGVIVRLAEPGKIPSYMRATGVHSPGHIKARIPCDQIARVNHDRNIVSVELREHVMAR